MQFLDKLFQVLKFIWNLYEIYEQDLSKVILNLCGNDKRLSQSAFYLTFYQQNFGRNVIFKQIASSTGKIYQ